jgi:hypothetical protein
MSYPVGMTPPDKAERIPQRWFRRRPSPVRERRRVAVVATDPVWVDADYDKGELPFIMRLSPEGARTVRLVA